MATPVNKLTRREALLAAGSMAAGAAVASIVAPRSAHAAGETVSTAASAPPPRPVPDTNRTSLGLYATPQEAYEMWKANPGRVHIIDVRTFEEYIFVGHADMARNIPLVFPKFVYPAETKTGVATPAGGPPPGCSGVPNPEFLSAVKGRFAPGDTLLMMCATGGRGAMAVNQLAKAGYTKAYNIINGLEGDRVNDPGSTYHGKRMRNGWKNCGLPWTYDFDADLMWASPS
jgi:rhodanese-related sulfurtransferase